MESDGAPEYRRPQQVEGDSVLSLNKSRWTTVDEFEFAGTRYIVAREDAPRGVSSLSNRERAIVTSLASGYTTKETAYALGISDATVRVLLSRAVTKLGAGTRAELLEHPEVRLLRRTG
jgi:DNA-binding CsgD family transcriptional regulator